MKGAGIRVVHSFPVWLPQTQTWMYNQVKYLPENVESHIVCERTEHLDQFHVPNIHCMYEISRVRYFWEKGIRNLGLPQYRRFLKNISTSVGAQILHSHFGHIGWNDNSAAKQTGIKHVITYYGSDVSMLPAQDKRWLSRYKELFSEGDLFLCEGPHMAQRLIALGCPKEKIKVHHLGVSIDSIPFRQRRWRSTEPLSVLIVASFREKKGIPGALEALAQFQQIVPIKITIIGDANSEASSKKEKRRILEIIEKAGLRPKTRLLGYQPYSVIFDEAYKHHVFISPSLTAADGDTEGGAPVSLIEMMATGMPVVSTLHCDIPEVVQYGIENWLVEERDVAGLVDKLQWLVVHSAEWDKMLARGRRHVEVEFNAPLQGKRLENTYRDILATVGHGT